MAYNPYRYDEPIIPRFHKYVRPEFAISTSTSNEALFIRLLCGSLTCTNLITTDSFDQFENYLSLGRITNGNVIPRTIKNSLEPDIKLNKVCAFLTDTKALNDDFFQHLLIEISSCFYKKQKGQHTLAFLHLYRTLEYISYSFPLIYSSHSRNYYGTFNSLKNYFDASKSELLFFNSFVEKIFDGLGYLGTNVTFNFNSLIPQVNSNHYKILKSYIATSKIISDSRNISITTTYDQLLDLAVKIRNRYFHFAVGGQRNIKGTDILESDIFFSIINDELLNWIAIIYFEILKTFCA
jgi:hypothetical protein